MRGTFTKLMLCMVIMFAMLLIPTSAQADNFLFGERTKHIRQATHMVIAVDVFSPGRRYWETVQPGPTLDTRVGVPMDGIVRVTAIRGHNQEVLGERTREKGAFAMYYYIATSGQERVRVLDAQNKATVKERIEELKKRNPDLDDGVLKRNGYTGVLSGELSLRQFPPNEILVIQIDSQGEPLAKPTFLMFDILPLTFREWFAQKKGIPIEQVAEEVPVDPPTRRSYDEPFDRRRDSYPEPPPRRPRTRRDSLGKHLPGNVRGAYDRYRDHQEDQRWREYERDRERYDRERYDRERYERERDDRRYERGNPAQRVPEPRRPEPRYVEPAYREPVPTRGQEALPSRNDEVPLPDDPPIPGESPVPAVQARSAPTTVTRRVETVKVTVKLYESDRNTPCSTPLQGAKIVVCQEDGTLVEERVVDLGAETTVQVRMGPGYRCGLLIPNAGAWGMLGDAKSYKGMRVYWPAGGGQKFVYTQSVTQSTTFTYARRGQ